MPEVLKSGLFYIGVSFLLSYALWIFYICVMALKRVKDAGKLGNVALFFGTPVLIVGLVFDLLVNVLVVSVILLEIPQETTVTARLKRHKRESTGWRLKVTNWLASELLDNFDPSGVHV